MIRIDLHTHSEASKDGGISPEQYAKLLKNEIVDIIAITDHDRIDFALGMQKALGADRIIVGEEITTTGGDIIGLYLKELVPAGLSPQETMDIIHTQGGLVCIPHPFETVRKGLSLELLNSLTPDIDIIEGHNGRAVFQNFGSKAIDWATRNNKLCVANSDAHGFRGVGRTYTVINSKPRVASELLLALKATTLVNKRPPVYTLLYPAINRIKKILSGYK